MKCPGLNGDISYHNATYRICVEIEFHLNAGFMETSMTVMAKQYLNWLRAYSAQCTFGVVVRSPHSLPVFNRNVSFLSFLAGDRGMATLQILHLTTNSTNGKISVSAIIRRHLPVIDSGCAAATSWSFLNFFDSEPACFSRSHSTSSKNRLFFPSSSRSSFPHRSPKHDTHPSDTRITLMHSSNRG